MLELAESLSTTHCTRRFIGAGQVQPQSVAVGVCNSLYVETPEPHLGQVQESQLTAFILIERCHRTLSDNWSRSCQHLHLKTVFKTQNNQCTLLLLAIDSRLVCFHVTFPLPLAMPNRALRITNTTVVIWYLLTLPAFIFHHGLPCWCRPPRQKQ